MDGRPSAAELVDAAAGYLDRLTEGPAGTSSYEARVAANVLRIVERELRLGEDIDRASAGRLAALPGAPGSGEELAELIRTGAIDAADPRLRAHLVADVRARIAVDSPAYPAVRTAEERWGSA